MVDEELDQVEVAAGGGGVQRRPPLRVGGVGVAAVLDQDAHHLRAVVDAALQGNGTITALFGQKQRTVVLSTCR